METPQLCMYHSSGRAKEGREFFSCNQPGDVSRWLVDVARGVRDAQKQEGCRGYPCPMVPNWPCHRACLSSMAQCSYHTALPARPAGKTRWGGEAAPAYSYWKLSVSQKSSLSGLHVSCSDLNSNWHCISEQKFALPSSWKLCSQPPDSPRTLSIAIFPHLPHDLSIPTIPTSHPPRTRVLLKLSSVRICPP